MAGNFNNSGNDDVARVKERIDIVEVISDKVRLKRAGRNYTGLCPFHNEKTASFHVSPERQSYHCFGCGRGGDVFSFVMESEGLDFRGALELLAARAGVELTAQTATRRGAASRDLYQVMDMAARFFQEKLNGPEGSIGQGYMQRRSLTRRDAERFGLGWSSGSWDGLLRHFRANQVPDQLALDSGLVLTGQSGNLYDRFRGRLMFPIRDITGRVIAFGGRLVDGEGAKYINSPENEIYSKRRNLYLLHEARTSIRERKRCILVEGYMDALRLHLNGFTETVASLGTSLTEEQARILKRFTDRCYICYDSDTAGQEATLRGMYILAGLGLDVYVISLPSGKDPDELLSSSPSLEQGQDITGKELFEKAIANARPLILQHLHAVRSQIDSPATRKTGIESLMSGLAQLDHTAISPYLGELAGALGLYPPDFWRELEIFRSKKKGSVKKSPDDSRNTNVFRDSDNSQADTMEAALCSLLASPDGDPYRYSQTAVRKVMSLLSDERVKEVAMALLTESPAVLKARWLELGEKWPLELIAQGDMFRDELEAGKISVSGTDPLARGSKGPWEIVTETLWRKRNDEKVRELEYKMKHNLATLDEILEFAKLSATLRN